MAKKSPPTYAETQPGNAELWGAMAINQRKLAAVDAAARAIVANRERYRAITKKTGVPYPLIGVLHMRERNFSFEHHLHNGDPLTGRTYRVPAGYPKSGNPPFTFEESAVDALKLKGLEKVKDWTIERVLYEAERFNGWGYRWNKAGNSPYVWAGTVHYTRGKYTSDGKLDRKHVDKQLGIAPVLKRAMELDRAHGLFLEADRKTAMTTVSGSKSLVALIVGFFMWIGTQITDAIQSGYDGIVGVISVLPSLVSSAQEHIATSQTIAEWLSIDWATAGRYIVPTIMLVVFVREFWRKRIAV